MQRENAGHRGGPHPALPSQGLPRDLEDAGQPGALGWTRAAIAVGQSRSQLLVPPVFPVIPLLWTAADEMLQMSLPTLANFGG